MMKKFFYYSALAAISALAMSCSKEINDEIQQEEVKMVPITFTTELTKTTVNIDGSTATVEWAEGDEVSIYYWGADGKAKTSVLTAQSAGASTTLSGMIEEGANPEYFYATYPKGKGELTKVEDQDNFVLKKPSANGTFASANLMAAYTTAEEKTFAFKNAVALLKVPYPTDGKLTHAGKEYELKGVRFKDIAGGVACMSDMKVNVADGQVASYENVSVTWNTMVNVTEEGRANGYVFIPVISGNPTDGFILQYVSKDGEIGAFGDIPAILATKSFGELNRGDIKTINFSKDIDEYIVWDYYVSNDGTGNGKSESAPMSYADFKALMNKVNSWCYAAALNGTTFHFKAETYNTYTAGEPIEIPIAGATFKTTFQGGWQGGTEHAKTVWSGANGTSAGAHIFSFNNKLRLYVRDFTFEYGLAANGGAIDIGALASGSPQSDAEFRFDCRDCIFQYNTTSAKGIGGAVLIRQGAKGGVVCFDNCYFNSNKAAANGITVASNGAASIYFNNCTLMEALPNNIATYIYMNGVGGKLGINNCTIKTDGLTSGTLVDKNNAMAIWNLGYTVVANTTFWTAKGYGKLGFAGFGCTKANEGSQNGSLYINCVFKNTCSATTPRYSFHLTKDYYQNIKSCWYNQINFNDAEQGDYTIQNSWAYNANSSVSDGAKLNHTVNGVPHYCYTYTTRPTEEQFSYETKTALKEAVKGVSVVGEPFNAWLESLGAYDYDITGAARGEDLFPGSNQQSTEYAK